MSVNRKVQWTSIYFRPRKQWLLALGLALTPWFAAVSWAENFNLDSVDFAATGDQTRIVLHTGSIVPVQKVLTSDNKLILEIDQVNANDTVRTNFAGATNISHVIMQPISEHKIRMIIRGENLAPPSVAFYDQKPAQSDSEGERLHRQTQAALRQIQESGIQSASYNPDVDVDPLPDVQPAVPKAEAKPAKPESKKISNIAELPEDETIPFGGNSESSVPSGSSMADAGKAKAEPAPEQVKPLHIPTLEMPAAGNELIEKAKSGQYNNYILGGLLALMALGIGGFVIHKINKLRQVEPDLEDLIQEQTNGKRVSFKEMAQAYRNKHDQPKKPEFASKPSGKKHAEDVIGLRSLSQVEEGVPIAAPQQTPQQSKPARQAPAEPVRQQQPQTVSADPFGGKTPTMEQLISMVQAVSEPKQAPIKTQPAKKQVVNQYMQAEKAKKQQPQKKSGFPDETMVKEMKRAQVLQQELLQQAQQQIASAQPGKAQAKAAPVNRATAAQKAVKPVNFKNAPATNPVNAKKAANPALNAPAVGKNGPLPGNPEVLNFLRNVADLMEKDGKPQIANSIHKNLNPGR